MDITSSSTQTIATDVDQPIKVQGYVVDTADSVSCRVLKVERF